VFILLKSALLTDQDNLSKQLVRSAYFYGVRCVARSFYISNVTTTLTSMQMVTESSRNHSSN